MNNIVGIRIRDKGRIYYFNPGELNLRRGDKVVVETSWGITFGTVHSLHKIGLDQPCSKELKAILRKITPDDESKVDSNLKLEQEALRFCLERIAQKGINMKLVDSEYLLDASKLIFYFTADERVDFRELVKDLAHRFKARIEMRQIGVRDEARIFAGYGCCGRSFCCSTFLTEFEPVTIRMAKNQDITLNPTKISGVCGRLMCCIAFEYNTYKEQDKERKEPSPNGAGSLSSKPMQREDNIRMDRPRTKRRRKKRRNMEKERGNNA